MKTLVIGPRVSFPGTVPLLITQTGTLENIDETISRTANRKEDFLDLMRVALPDEKILDIASVQCDEVCKVVEGDSLLYIDYIHFSKAGAIYIGERLKNEFNLRDYLASFDE